jgi:hypothetical protein
VNPVHSLRPEFDLPGNVVDFPTIAPETWLAHGHEPLSVREAALRLGVSESTMRRRLRERTPNSGTATTLAELKGMRIAAHRIEVRFGRSWTVYLLGPAFASSQGGPAPVAELRSRMVADEAAAQGGHHWWRFGR